MSTIGELAVNVVARTQKFVEGIGKARKETRLFEAGVGNLTSRLYGLTGAVTATFTLAGLKAAADEMDAIGHAAPKVNTSREALSGLAYAAELSESSVEGLTTGLTVLEKQLGSGKAEPALERLGLKLQDLKQLRADEAFLRIATAMQDLGTAADKTFVATKLFGSSSLMSLLDEGPAKIRAMIDEAGTLGLVFGDKPADAIDRSNDSLTRMKNALKGAGREAVDFLAPYVEFHANVGTELLKADRRFLFGTEKGPRQAAADKRIASMNDELFVDFTRETPLGELDEFLARAVRTRLDKLVEKQQHFAGDPAFTGLAGFGMNAFLAFNQQAIQDDINRRKDDEWRNLGGAEAQRIANAIAELAALDDQGVTPETSRPTEFMPGAFGQEAGTAEAFRQERRTALAAQNDIPAKQLAEAKEQTKRLANIDKNLSETATLEIVNIA